LNFDYKTTERSIIVILSALAMLKNLKVIFNLKLAVLFAAALSESVAACNPPLPGWLWVGQLD
jgi:hypothetical protein